MRVIDREKETAQIPQLSFRRAARADIAAIVALVNSGYRGESSKRGWTTEADLLGGQRTDAREISELIDADASVFLLCFDASRLIGSVHLERAADGAYLGMFTVEPARQGQGIGKRFMEEAERFVRTQWDAEKMMMLVISVRAELIAFYERRGYRRTGVFKAFPDDIRFGIPKAGRLQFELLEKPLR